MVKERRTSREIDGRGKTVRELLAGRKYSIDYYQREYKWQTKQVAPASPTPSTPWRTLTLMKMQHGSIAANSLRHTRPSNVGPGA